MTGEMAAMDEEWWLAGWSWDEENKVAIVMTLIALGFLVSFSPANNELLEYVFF